MNPPRSREAAKAWDENAVAREIVDAALEIHRDLGPGLLESVYEVVLADELARRGLAVQRQVAVPIAYKGRKFLEGFRADLIVERKVCVEIKSTEAFSKSDPKQLRTYLRLLNLRVGLLLNFNAPLLKDGIKRIVNGLENDPYARPTDGAPASCLPSFAPPRLRGQ
jgi:GxxExxY protein